MSAAFSTSDVSDPLFFAGAAIGVVGLLTAGFFRNVGIQRRIYWLSWFFGIILMAASAWSHSPAQAATVVGLGSSTAVLYAYLRTSYLKIAGRTYAYTIFHGRPDPQSGGSAGPLMPDPPADAYGRRLTAPKMWWTLVFLTACASGTALSASAALPAAIGGSALLSLLTGAIGYIDAREAFTPARRQIVQASTIAVLAIPLFLAPALAYAVCYLLVSGRRNAA